MWDILEIVALSGAVVFAGAHLLLQRAASSILFLAVVLAFVWIQRRNGTLGRGVRYNLILGPALVALSLPVGGLFLSLVGSPVTLWGMIFPVLLVSALVALFLGLAREAPKGLPFIVFAVFELLVSGPFLYLALLMACGFDRACYGDFWTKGDGMQLMALPALTLFLLVPVFLLLGAIHDRWLAGRKQSGSPST